MKWTDMLSGAVYDRLCCCRTLKSDLPELVNAKFQSFKNNNKWNLTKEDALVAVLELLDCNSVYIELTHDEYSALCN